MRLSVTLSVFAATLARPGVRGRGLHARASPNERADRKAGRT